MTVCDDSIKEKRGTVTILSGETLFFYQRVNRVKGKKKIRDQNETISELRREASGENCV
jgi:hypothetical protein